MRAALDLACDADSDSPEPWRARARLEAQLGDGAAAARAHLSASIRAEGEEAGRAALDAARLFEDAGRHGDAVRAYRAALHARPGCVPEESLRAAEALAAGDVAAAADLLAGIDPSALPGDWRAPHARKLARALDAAGRAGDAARAWLEIFHEAPADPEAFARAADLALASGGGVDAWVDLAAEHEQALGAWATAERRRDLRCERGRLFAEAGRLEAARGALLAALELDPGHGPTLDALAALDDRPDDWTRIAAGLWEEGGAAADPAEAAAIYLRLGRLLSDRLRDEGGAIAALRAALARAAASPSPAAARCAAEARALLEELGAAAEEAPPAGAPAGGPLDGVAVVLRAQADAEAGAARAELLERLAAHLERGGDREGAADALEGAVLADPPRDAAFAGLAALVAPDDARLARAAEARERRADGDAPETWFAFEAGAVDLEVPPEEPGAVAETPIAFEGGAAEPEAPPEEPGVAAETPIAFEGGAAEPEAPPEEPGAAPSPPPGDGALPAEAANDPVSAAAGDAASPEAHGGEEDAFAFAADEEEALDVESSLPPIDSGDPQDYARDGRLRHGGRRSRPARTSGSRSRSRASRRTSSWRGTSRAWPSSSGSSRSTCSSGRRAPTRSRRTTPSPRRRASATSPRCCATGSGRPTAAGVMLEKALALVPDDPDTRRELVQVWSSHRRDVARAPSTIWLDLARADPSDGEALAGVAEVAAARRRARPGGGRGPADRSAARIAASLASFVAPATCAPPSPGAARRARCPRSSARGSPRPARSGRSRGSCGSSRRGSSRSSRRTSAAAARSPADRLAPDRAPVLAADARRRGARAPDAPARHVPLLAARARGRPREHAAAGGRS